MTNERGLGPGRSSGERGITLIEILVALAIVGLLAAGAMMGIGAVTNADLRRSAGEIAASVRFLWNQAASTGFAHRLVLDLDTGAISAEFADGKVLLKNKNDDRPLDDDEDEGPVAGDEGAEEVELGGLGNLFAGLDGAGAEEEGRTPRFRKPAFNTFAAVKALRPHRLPGNVTIRMIYATHMTEPVTEGRAELYFFPGGMTERALIHLASGARVFSILVHPVTGRARVFPEEVDLPADLREFDTPEEERYE